MAPNGNALHRMFAECSAFGFYADGNQYQRIADVSGVANPDLVHPGQVLTIP